ncbi:MAG: S9 family peptidase, partial [Sphingorhabdus sp.]
MRFAFLLGVATVAMATPSATWADDAATSELIPVLAYPQTRRQNVIDEQFGVKVADPYRWLEDDVRVTPEVAAWVKSQNAVTDRY